MENFSLSKKILRSIIVALAIVLFLVVVYFILVWTGLWEQLNSVEKLKNFILGLGFYGRTAFVLFQFLQVTFIPLPSPIFVIAGSLIYGPFQSGLLSLAGILLGSAFAFFLGRVFGRKLVNFMVGNQTQKKWTTFLNNYKYSFFIMMLLPLFPDDILCLVAGLTDMSWGYFMFTQLISRPIGVFLISYFSSGEVIPYHGWGLAVWGVIFIVAILLIYLSTKYNKQIENFIKKLFKNNKKAKNKSKIKN